MTVDENATYEELVSVLSQGLGQRQLYFSSHPRVQEYSREFVEMLHALLGRERTDTFFLGLVEGQLVHKGLTLVGPNILGKRIIDFLALIGSGGILFRAGLRADEVLQLLDLSAEFLRDVPELSRLQTILNERNVTHLEFSPPYEDPGWFGQFHFDGVEFVPGGPNAGGGAAADVVPIYQDMFETVSSAHHLAESNAAIEIDHVRTVSEQLVNAGRGGFTDVMQMVRYPDYDSFTVGHSVRVAMIAVLVAHRAGLPDEFLIELGTAGLLHDVGKAEVPKEILYKPASLTDEEQRIIARHPVAGAQILLENRSAGPMAIAAAWGHHLRYDGGGYPRMAKWGFSSQVTALLRVCDVFEAMTAVRPYKSALAPRRAYEVMLSDPGAYHPGAFKALVAAMGMYPPGSTVMLSNGAQGLVLSAGAQIDGPVIRITHDCEGFPVPGEAQEVRDLSQEPRALRVALLLDPMGAREPDADFGDVPHAGCNHGYDETVSLGRLMGKRY